MTLQVSIIIVNYNAGTELCKCVQSVLKSSIDLEIVIIDNNSTDMSLVQLAALYPGVKQLTIIRNSNNLGFAIACNQGSSASKGNFFLYLNPDCVVEPSTIPILLDFLEKHPKVGMAGGLIFNHDGSEQRGCRRAIPTPWKSLVNSFGLKRLAGLNKKAFSDFRLDGEPLPAEPVEVDAISGACMMVSRKAFLKVGSMDEGYFLHCEDLDWCMRFKQQGLKIMFVPQARLLHSKGSCSVSRPVFVEWSKHKGMVRFYKKFFAEDHPVLMFSFVWLGIWFRFGLTLIKIYFHKLPGMRSQND